ncbi:CLUMA_CG007864, isoform A [Clunio marinus]|uniref:CLUMA_CG007864, isoform A n=1 Tax=Clunio marinus TaxID=568069 RepID=A0A1J1I5Y3_9DIPT|nr:CLUMA_CG007864, isoform A [Clunio marinus]
MVKLPDDSFKERSEKVKTKSYLNDNHLQSCNKIGFNGTSSQGYGWNIIEHNFEANGMSLFNNLYMVSSKDKRESLEFGQTFTPRSPHSIVTFHHQILLLWSWSNVQNRFSNP